MSEQKHYMRFSVAQRIEHWAQMLSFFTLGLTGLPQKFAGDGWAEAMIGAMGGIEFVRNIHHLSATVMALACIYHVIAIAYKVFVLRVRWTMFPRLDDLLDALDVMRFNLGLAKDRPKLDRFSFEEKAEYWAFVWGAVVMGLTGFMMWNPINTARFVPGDLIPAAKAAHGGEALLAVLAIIVWHLYSVHLKMFNKAMFTGKLSEHEMAHEHGLELERIRSGKIDPRPASDVIKHRERWFLPVASISAVVMLVVLYLFLTYESTAITTLPKRATVQSFAPITLTPTPRAGAPTAVSAAKALPVSHEGRTTCNNCHANNIGPKNPVDHAGRIDATCSACHKFASQAPATKPAAAGTPAPTSASSTSGGLKALPANHDGRATCNNCHANNIGPKNPVDHAGRQDATCTACHKFAGSAAPASAATTAPVATQPPVSSSSASSAPMTAPAATKPPVSSSSAPAATVAPTKASVSSSSASGGIKALPASHAGRTACNVCHETGAMGPKNPADHAGRADATCVACHKLP